jgi:hypothetical protein
MPNQRAKNQILVALAMDVELAAAMDKARTTEFRQQSRSEFIREAMARELRRRGIPLKEGLASAPDRVRLNRLPAQRADRGRSKGAPQWAAAAERALELEKKGKK